MITSADEGSPAAAASTQQSHPASPMLPVALLLLVAAVSADIDVDVSVDWDSEIIRTRTAVSPRAALDHSPHLATHAATTSSTGAPRRADRRLDRCRTHWQATVEVDVMPFLGRTQEGGSFNAYAGTPRACVLVCGICTDTADVIATALRARGYCRRLARSQILRSARQPRLGVRPLCAMCVSSLAKRSAALLPLPCAATSWLNPPPPPLPPLSGYPNPRVVVPELTPVDCTKDKPATNWNSTLFDGIMRDFMHAVCGPNAESGECKLSVVQQLSTMPSWMYKGGYCQDASPSCLPLDPWDTTDPFNAYAAGKGK
jgi:hypothetical protein